MCLRSMIRSWLGISKLTADMDWLTNDVSAMYERLRVLERNEKDYLGDRSRVILELRKEGELVLSKIKESAVVYAKNINDEIFAMYFHYPGKQLVSVKDILRHLLRHLKLEPVITRKKTGDINSIKFCPIGNKLKNNKAEEGIIK